MAILETIDRTLSSALENQTFAMVLRLSLILYGGILAPNLPPLIAQYLDNPIVKVVGLTLILVLMNYDITASLLVAVAFVLTMISINNLKIFRLGDVLTSQVKQQAQQQVVQTQQPVQPLQDSENSSSDSETSSVDTESSDENIQQPPGSATGPNGNIPQYANNSPSPSIYEPSTRINIKRDLENPDAPYEAEGHVRYGRQPMNQTNHFPLADGQKQDLYTPMLPSGEHSGIQGLAGEPSAYDGPYTGATIGGENSQL